jgi:hypothetical protein
VKGNTCKFTDFVYLLISYFGFQIREGAVSGACDMCGGEERRVQGLVRKPERKP